MLTNTLCLLALDLVLILEFGKNYDRKKKKTTKNNVVLVLMSKWS